MLDVCLLSIPKPQLRRPSMLAPLGLLYLAAVLERAGRSCRIYNLGYETQEEAIELLPAARVYGISLLSLEVEAGQAFAAALRERYPSAPVLIGGIGARDFPQPQPEGIICVEGEAELEIADIVACCLDGSLSGSVLHCLPPTDLDALPFPARHLLQGPQGGAIFAGEGDAFEESTGIQASRGCPMSCAYCAAPRETRLVRRRSAESVANEVASVIERHGIRRFRFSDDCLNANPEWLRQLCAKLEYFDIEWRGSARSKPASRELAWALTISGCRELSIGVESFDDAVLKMLNKKACVQDSFDAIETFTDAGIAVRALLMARTPGQRRETMELNRAAIERLSPNKLVSFSCTYCTPLPRSPLWETPERFRIELIQADDHSAFNFYSTGREGARHPEPTFRLLDRSLEEFDQESHEFVEWLRARGVLNAG